MKQKLEQVIKHLKQNMFVDHDEAFTRGWNKAMEFAIARLQMEVIDSDETSDTRITAGDERDTESKQQ